VRGALLRWVRRPSRVPPILRATVAAVLGALAVSAFAVSASQGQTGVATSAGQALLAPGGPRAGLANAPAKSPVAPAPGDPTTTYPSSPALIAQGRALYLNGCSSCHGIALGGIAGVAPSLRGVGPGPVDFYVSTGRMPLEQPREEPMRATALYNRSQINALIAFVSAFGGPPAPAADPSKGDLALGLHTFTLHCAGCHQIVARGGLTLGAVVPDLQQATALQVAEAVRMGPYLMPHFDTKQIDQHQLDSLARYVLWTRHPSDAGGWGIDNIGPIPEGIVAWFMALAAMVIVARLIGERIA
jgi:ubiquinol-cytochrome c reductase cytochrome c subunit